MRDPDLEPKFPWTLALFVTGISFLIFCKVLEILNSSYPPFFLWIALAALLAGCIGGLRSLLVRSKNASRQRIDQ